MQRISELKQEQVQNTSYENELKNLHDQLLMNQLELQACQIDGKGYLGLYKQTKENYSNSNFPWPKRKNLIYNSKKDDNVQRFITNKFDSMRAENKSALQSVYNTLDNYFKFAMKRSPSIEIPNRNNYECFKMKDLNLTHGELFIRLFFDEMFSIFFPPNDLEEDEKKKIKNIMNVLVNIDKRYIYTSTVYKTITKNIEEYKQFTFLQEYLKWKKHVVTGAGGDIKTEINNIINKMVEQNGIIGGSEKKIQQIKDNVYNDIMLKISDLT